MRRSHIEDRLITEQELDTEVAEAYRSIRTSLHYACFHNDTTSLLFTSSVAGEGKSTVVSNMGILTALEDKKVLLIDADLRRPNLHHLFRTGNRTGLSTILTGYSEAEPCIQQTHLKNLFLLPSGPIQPHPTELLGSARFERMLAALRKEYEAVYIDSPAILSVTDAAILARYVQGIVLIVRPLLARKEHLKKSQRIFEPFSNKIVGVVMNGKTDKS
jgi:protein-tyrosine kinase